MHSGVCSHMSALSCVCGAPMCVCVRVLSCVSHMYAVCSHCVMFFGVRMFAIVHAVSCFHMHAFCVCALVFVLLLVSACSHM